MTMADNNSAKAIRFAESQSLTMTGTNFLSGVNLKVVNINASPAVGQFIITKSGAGVISCDYLNIGRFHGHPDNTWYAGTHSIEGTNVSGWIFTDPPAPTTSFAAFNAFMAAGD